MSEIEHYTPTAAEIAEVQNELAAAAVTAIDSELAVIEKAAGVVPTLVDGKMVPARYTEGFQSAKGARPQSREEAIAKAMAAAVYGATLGFGVSKSLKNVFTVHGEPSIYARTAVALVQSRGHEVWTESEADDCVVVCGRRRGLEKVERSEWTIARAERAGYVAKNAKYKTQPREMLYAKAAMSVCRRIAADVLEGVPRSVEEIEMEQPNVRMDAKRLDVPGGRGAAGLRAALAASEPEADAEPETDAEDGEEPESAKAPEVDQDLLDEVAGNLEGFDTREAVEAFMAEVKSGDFTPAEVSAISELATARWQKLPAGDVQ